MYDPRLVAYMFLDGPTVLVNAGGGAVRCLVGL